MKSMRWVFLLSGVIALISIGGVMVSVAADVDWPRIGQMDLSEMMENGIGPMIIMVVALIIVILTLYSSYRMISPAQIKNGVAAEAKILKVWDTGTTVNDNPQIGLLLEVTAPDGSSFQAEAKTLVSRLSVALVQPGTAAKVVYDPEKPKRIQVREVCVGNPAGSGALARMEELEQLRERRLISEAEYQEKRKRILENL
jgi:hypothetical protein